MVIFKAFRAIWDHIFLSCIHLYSSTLFFFFNFRLISGASCIATIFAKLTLLNSIVSVWFQHVAWWFAVALIHAWWWRICWLFGKQEKNESDIGEVQSEDGFTHWSCKRRSQIEPRQYHLIYKNEYPFCFPFHFFRFSFEEFTWYIFTVLLFALCLSLHHFII